MASSSNDPITNNNIPTYAVDNAEVTTQNLDKCMQELFNTCSLIIKNYVEIYATIVEPINNISIKIKDLSTAFERYKKCYSITTDDVKILYHITPFDIIVKNSLVLLQITNNDSWISKENLKIVYGSHKGVTSSMIIYLSEIYRYSLKVKENYERNMKEFPEFHSDKDIKLHLSTVMLNNIFRIFKMTETIQNDKEKKDVINKIIDKFEVKLGIKRQQPFDLTKTLDGVVGVTTDLVNKYAAKETDPNKKLSETQVKTMITKIFNQDGLKKIIDNVQNMTSKSEGPPDLGSIISGVINDVNPLEIMESMQKTVEETIPKENTSDEKQQNSEEIVEDIIEEIEEEILSE